MVEHAAVNRRVVGSSPTEGGIMHSSMVERRAFNPAVAGSSPVAPKRA
jgi:hypothetical protein